MSAVLENQALPTAMSAMESDMSKVPNSAVRSALLRAEAQATLGYFEEIITTFMGPSRIMFIALKVAKHGGQPVLLSKNFILKPDDETETILPELLSRSTSTFRLSHRIAPGSYCTTSLEHGLAAAVARMQEAHDNA